MAYGLPVIASAWAGASEIIEDCITGLILHQLENHEELAALLRRLFRDKALQQELSNTAAQAAKGFSWETNAVKTLDFLNEKARAW